MSQDVIEYLWSKYFHKYDCILAGGCVRDSVLGQPVKDYDLYISYADFHDFMVDDFKINNVKVFGKGDDLYNHHYLYGRTGIEIDCRDVDILITDGTHSPIGMTDIFDFGICKCWYDGELHLSPEFHLDVTLKQHTLYRTDWGLLGCFKHLERIQAKYPWPVVVKDGHHG